MLNGKKLDGRIMEGDVLAMVDTVVKAVGSPLTRTSEMGPVVVGDQVMVKAWPAEMAE